MIHTFANFLKLVSTTAYFKNNRKIKIAVENRE